MTAAEGVARPQDDILSAGTIPGARLAASRARGAPAGHVLNACAHAEVAAVRGTSPLRVYRGTDSRV